MQSGTLEVVEQAIWALGNIAGDSPECRNLVLEAGALERLREYCKPIQTPNEAQLSLLRNATWTLSNFCRGRPPPEWNYVKEALPILQALLTVEDEEVTFFFKFFCLFFNLKTKK